MSKLTIVIPAYNEAGSLPDTLPAVLSYCKEHRAKVIVVNDGSKDDTRQVLAIELICALQAVDFRGVDKMAPITKRIYDEARKVTPSIIKDRIFSYDIEKVNNWMMGKGFNIKLD